MPLLKAKNIQLRALEPSDLDWLFAIENDETYWEISNTLRPFSKDILTLYIANAHQDIFTAKQLRLVIDYQNIPVGLIDLYDFNPQHHRAGLGILVLPKYQTKGIANDVINLMTKYAFEQLQMHQIYVTITADNKKSIDLFHKLGFENIGKQKDWLFCKGQYKDELLLQLINNAE